MISLTDRPLLVADIGGTNARFALCTKSGDLLATRVLPCARHASLIDAVNAYLSLADCHSVQDAVIAIATPVLGDEISMTNHHWSFSVKAVKQQLGLDNLLVVNDFFALAMSLPYLNETQLQRLDTHGHASAGVKMVMGPGTGLGVAALAPLATGAWQPIASEGGHISFAPANATEIELLKCLWNKYPHVSAERLACGPGIALLYCTLCEMAGTQPATDEPSQVVELAANSTCPIARKSIEMFCEILGSVAGNLALTFGSNGGFYLGGGVISKLGPLFDTDRFLRRFTAKGRFASYLEAIPIYLILEKYPAIIGAARLFAIEPD